MSKSLVKNRYVKKPRECIKPTSTVVFVAVAGAVVAVAMVALVA